MEVDVICTENCSAHDCSSGMFYERFTDVPRYFYHLFFGSSIVSVCFLYNFIENHLYVS